MEITKEVAEERGVSINIDGGVTLKKGGIEYYGGVVIKNGKYQFHPSQESHHHQYQY